MTDVVNGFLVPSSNIIQLAVFIPTLKNGVHILHLTLRTPLMANEGRITHDIVQIPRRYDLIPIHTKGIALVNIGIRLQRQRVEGEADDFIRFLHHLGLGYPEGRLGHGAGKVVDFDAVELVDGDLDGFRHFSNNSVISIDNAKSIVFESSERRVGFREEVAGTAGRVKEFQL